MRVKSRNITVLFGLHVEVWSRGGVEPWRRGGLEDDGSRLVRNDYKASFAPVSKTHGEKWLELRVSVNYLHPADMGEGVLT